MTDNEIQLIEMIRNHPNPEQALLTAIEIICDYVTESSFKLSKLETSTIDNTQIPMLSFV